MLDLEAEYNNRARVPEHPELIAGWARDAAAYRERTVHQAGIAYGSSPRTVYDVFPGAGSGGPVAMFIHGGYWQALDRSFFSHMAAGPNARELSVAVPSYDLCPDVPLATIVDEMRAAALHLWRRTGRRVLPFGHSAGGHLTAMLLATDWRALDEAAPADLCPAGLAVSGLFDLVPLAPTSVNAKLGLDLLEAARLSPLCHSPYPGVRLVAAVGGAESSEYLRQSATITQVWRHSGAATRYLEIPGANHFTVIAGLADPDSALTQALIDLASP
jgi:arylformamidase